MEQTNGQGRTGLKEIIRLGIILAIFAGLAGAALAQTHGVTAPIIQEREEAALLESLRNGLPEAKEFEAEEVEGVMFYRGMKDGDVIGIIALTESLGYVGPIRLMVVLTPEGEIESVDILRMSETPGIGTKIYDEAFLNQYTGISEKESFEAVHTISGATVSARAVTDGVQNVMAVFQEIK